MSGDRFMSGYKGDVPTANGRTAFSPRTLLRIVTLGTHSDTASRRPCVVTPTSVMNGQSVPHTTKSSPTASMKMSASATSKSCVFCGQQSEREPLLPRRATSTVSGHCSGAAASFSAYVHRGSTRKGPPNSIQIFPAGGGFFAASRIAFVPLKSPADTVGSGRPNMSMMIGTVVPCRIDKSSPHFSVTSFANCTPQCQRFAFKNVAIRPNSGLWSRGRTRVSYFSKDVALKRNPRTPRVLYCLSSAVE
mmetsp:Transcript_61090/g.170894  ORF Transcript_61090/g.170894 Transcript_61090/m.170894 type:complete len:248 (+) Transcript_61090:608-1351(+)